MVLRLVDRYVSAKILAPFAAILCIGLSILLVERIVSVLNNTFGKGDVLFSVLEMLAYLAPYNLGFAIPIALYLAVLMGFSRMARENGIDALMANGISLQRMILPAMIFSLILGAISVFVIGWLQPQGRYAYRSLLYKLENLAVYALVDEGVFLHADGRTIIIDKIDRDNSSFKQIFVYEEKSSPENPNKFTSQVNTAESGVFIPDTGKVGAVLRLANGGLLKVDRAEKTIQPDEPGSHQWGGFASSEIPLGRESALIFRTRGNDERELTLVELFRRQDNPPANSNPDKMRAELHNRLVRILMLPILPLLAVPFALGPRRSLSSLRFALAFIVLVAFHQVLDQGAFLTAEKGVSPWLTQWLPYGLITLFALWRFWQAAFTVTKPFGFWAYLNFDWLRARFAGQR